MKGMGVFVLTLFIAVVSTLNGQYYHQFERKGSYARILSMGSNDYIADPYFITVNPAWISKYDNFVFGDIGSTVANNFESGGIGQFIGVNLRANRNFSFGALFTRRDFNGGSIAKLDPYGLVNETNATIGGAPVTPLDNNVVLLGSYSSGGHTLGLGISYTSSTKENKPANGGSEVGTASQLGVNVGYLSSLSRELFLDLGAYMIFPATSLETQQTSETTFSQTIIGARARAFYYTSSRVAIVPVVSFLNSKGSAKIGDQAGVTTTDLPAYTLFSIGVGINYKIGDFLLAGGPSYEIFSVTEPEISGVRPKLTSTKTSFPHWKVGAEWNLTDWFIGRIGYNVSTSKESVQSATSPTTKNEVISTAYSPANGGLTLGVGFRFGGFSLDATVNEDVLRQGFNNIGGGGATFSYLSASFAF